MADANIFTVINWGKKEDVLAFIDQQTKNKEHENMDVERQAEINLAWYRGHQLLRWNRQSSQLQLQGNPFHRVRLTVNLMAGLIDGYIAKIGLDRIRLAVRPSSDDIQDYNLADLQSKILQYYGEHLGLDQLVDELDTFATLMGEGFLKIVWDSQAGSEMAAPNAADLDMTPQEFEREVPNASEMLATGDVALTVLPVFNIFWGPQGCDFEDAEWVLEVYERPVAALMRRYRLSKDDITVKSEPGLRIWRPGETNVYGTVSHSREDDVALVQELWCRKNRQIEGLKKGGHFIAIGDKLVLKGPNPYKHGKIPIFRLPLIKVPAETRGHTPVKDLLVVQMDVNRTISQFAENRELMAQPTWLAREGSISDMEEWNNRPGGIRFYTGEMPLLQPGLAMPMAVLAMLERHYRHMQDIIGLRDVSQGRNPAGVRSGRSIALLKEADDERIARLARRRRKFWSDGGQTILELIDQYATEERIVQIGGEESELETVTFSQDMLRGDGRARDRTKHFNVYVQTTGLPRSQSARREALDQALERGALNPAEDPRDKSLVLDILELKDVRRPLDPKRKARRLQAIRNQRMLKGEYLAPDIREDLDELLEGLSRFIHEPFFRGLPDETKQLFYNYEAEAIGLMGLRQERIAMLVNAARKKAGLPELPAPGQNPENPPNRA